MTVYVHINPTRSDLQGKAEIPMVDSVQPETEREGAHEQEIVAVGAAPPGLDETFADMLAQLAPRSRRIYQSDLRHFRDWLATERGSVLSDVGSLKNINRQDMTLYRAHLDGTYAKVTAARMLAVAKRFLDEAVTNGVIAASPAARVKGIRGGSDETTHTALTLPQLEELLRVIDRSTALGLRDYALIMLLARTGIRRSEAAALDMVDLTQEQGHRIIVVRHGKGNKRRIAKVPVDVGRSLDAYLSATGRTDAPPDAPLFIGFVPNMDRVRERRLTDGQMARIVIGRAKAIGVHLTPHGLRASFVTIALENGAKLQQVQYAVGHADPRTTERYQRRKLNLDDNAADFIKIRP